VDYDGILLPVVVVEMGLIRIRRLKSLILKSLTNLRDFILMK
jgi:hypothetical protein